MKRLKKLNELHFDKELDGVNVKLNPDTNKSFAFDVKRDDMDNLEDILKRNNIVYEVVDGGNELPF